MTKINKLGKSTFVIAILSFLLVAVLAFGGTYAYFSDKSDEVSGSVTLGKLQITGFTAGVAEGKISLTTEEVVPNQTIMDSTTNAITVGIDSNIDYYVRAIVSVSVKAAEGAAAHETTCGDYVDESDSANLLKILDITLDEAWTEAEDAEGEATGVYYKSGKQSATTQTYAAEITVDAGVGADGCAHWMGAQVTVTIQFEVLQAEYLGTKGTDGYTNIDDLHADWTDYVTTKIA